MNEYTSPIGIGVFHSGIEVYGRGTCAHGLHRLFSSEGLVVPGYSSSSLSSCFHTLLQNVEENLPIFVYPVFWENTQS